MSILGGKSRRCKACRDWSKHIIERDGNKCSRCEITEKLHAHHIIPWKDNPKLRFDLSNGICLCQKCHGKETRKENPSVWNKGKKLSTEHKLALSKGHRGQKAWNKGIEYILPHERECTVCKEVKKIEKFTPQGKYRTRMCKVCRNSKLNRGR